MKAKSNRTIPIEVPLKSDKSLVQWTNVVVTIIFMLFAAFLTLGQNKLLLWKLQDLDLFVFTTQFWMDILQKPGGLTLYLATFLNQFFYFPWLGTVIYLSLLLLVSQLTAQAFNLKGKALPLSFIPSLALLLIVTQLGYTIYLLKIDGYAFIPVLGILCALTSFIWFKKIQDFRRKNFFVVAFILIAYPICGAYAVFGGLLMLLQMLKSFDRSKGFKAWIPSIILLLSVALVPYLYFLFVYPSIALQNLWVLHLPAFEVSGSEKILWLPYLLMFLFFILVTIRRERLPKTTPSLLNKSGPILLFLAVLVLILAFSYKDKNFKTEIAMQSATEKSDWREVLRSSKENADEPTRLIVMYTHLALQKLGIAGDSLYQYKDGNKPVQHLKPVLPVQMAGKMFYYQNGKLNYSYRWCMEEMVEYGMSVSVLKQFVLTSILNGEYAVAQKYNDPLKSTLFYRSWALEQQKYIDDPRKISENPESGNILKLTAFGNSLDGDNSQLETYLSVNYTYMEGGTPDMVELSIQYNLDQKNIERFWPRFFLYARTHDRIPVHYQEAALLYYYLEKKVDISWVRFNPEIVDEFQLLLSFSQKYAGYPEASIQQFYENEFGGSFWYYYFFNKEHSYVNTPSNEK